ncbi:hypothetical protein [Brucella melitensis]|uniref:hypothetical protein n=1 Tax=Brucella melitensis TaxID=29459 RepID=UPI000B602FF9|nr:hypothetical protein BK189_12355 [Brucella melitensis]
MDGPGRARCQVNLFPPFLSSTFAQFPPGAFSWVYKETGPLWRVEIGRRKVHASDHECTCGNH